jgi:SulP family sulfate permease
MIGQSTINIMNGAKYRVSSTTSGLFMLLFTVYLSQSIELLPIPTLTGVLFMVVLSTFQWKTFVILRYGRMSDSATIIIVTLVAVFMNLAAAMLAGIVFKSLVYAWDSGSYVTADIQHKQMLINGEECHVKYMHICGVIFFSSARKFVDMFSATDDPDTVIIDLKDGLVIDHSAVAAIQGIMHRFSKAGKRVLLTNIPHKCHGRLHRTGDHTVLKRHIAHNNGIRMQDVHLLHQPLLVGGEEQAIADEATFGGMISDLPMFDVPTESVDQQLSVLEEIQGSVIVKDSMEKDEEENKE